jgi:C_GCAxxG_C_C family probable redox protein
MRLAAGFAGGMRCGETCGAVTGAFMVLGLRHSAEDCATQPGRAETYGRVVEFADRFRQRNGALSCRELLGCDISTPEGLAQAKEQGLFRTTCVQMVQDAAEILEEMEDELLSPPEGRRDA